jgi:hypothetical protein
MAEIEGSYRDYDKLSNNFLSVPRRRENGSESASRGRTSSVPCRNRDYYISDMRVAKVRQFCLESLRVNQGYLFLMILWLNWLDDASAAPGLGVADVSECFGVVAIEGEVSDFKAVAEQALEFLIG